MKKLYTAPQSENVQFDPLMQASLTVGGSPVEGVGAESPLRNFSGTVTPVRYI